MYIRLNVPDWTLTELMSGLEAITVGRSHFVRRLHEYLLAYASPWQFNVHLLANARSALVLAIQSLGMDCPRVAVPAYVCPAVVAAIRFAGAEAAFVDVEPDSFRFGHDALNSLLSRIKVDAVLAPDTYGFDQDFPSLRAFGIPVIEDAAYQAGRSSSSMDAPCGLRGDFGIWSFNFKSLCSAGGGVLFSKYAKVANARPPQLSTRVLDFKKFFDYAVRSALGPYIPRCLPGASPPTRESEGSWGVGIPETMTEVQAALAIAQWYRRNDLYARQADHIRSLSAIVARSSLVRAAIPDGVGPVHFLPLIFSDSQAGRETEVHRFRTLMHTSGVQTQAGYPFFANRAMAPNACCLTSRLILIPCGAGHSDRSLQQVASALERTISQIEH